jgi:hypothetical protein
MSAESSIQTFGIEAFYKFIGEGKLMATKCNKCGEVMLPPKPLCSKCFGNDISWIEVRPRGRLLTYTVIHVAPKQFETQAPYAIGIVKLEDGPKLLGMIRGIEPDKLKIDMQLTMGFEKTTSTQIQWPAWSKYYFKPV